MRNPAFLFYFWVIYDMVSALRCPDGRQVVCDRFCFYVYQPVCGSNFQTYPNSCELNAVRDCCGVFLYILYGGPCMPPAIVPFPQFYAPSAVPLVMVTNEVNSGNQGQQTSNVNPGNQGQQTPQGNPGNQVQQAPNGNSGNQGPQTTNGNNGNQEQQTPNLNTGNQVLQIPNVNPGNQGLQIPTGIPVSAGTISQGTAAANGGANSTAIGNDENSIQHTWTSTAVNAGVNAQVGQQQAKNS